MLVEFSAIIFSNKFSSPFSLFSTPGTPVIWKLVCLMLSQRCLKLFSFFKFLLFCSDGVISITLSHSSLFCFYVSIYLLLTPFSLFLFYSLYSSSLFDSLLYFPTLLLNFCVLPFFCIFWASLWSFLRLLIYTSFSSLSEVLPCSFIWNIFLCLLILPDSLCLFLCIRYAGYISWSCRCGLIKEMFCGAQ